MATQKMEGGYFDIDPQDVVEQGEFLMIDIREPHEWVSDLGHIADSKLQPLASFFQEGFDDDVSKEQSILLICRSGRRSAHAATVAVQEWGYQKVYNLRGGMIAWNRAELPIQRDIVETPSS